MKYVPTSSMGEGNRLKEKRVGEGFEGLGLIPPRWTDQNGVPGDPGQGGECRVHH